MKLKKYFLIVFVLLMTLSSTIAKADEHGNTKADITFLSGNLSMTEMSTFSFGSHTIAGVYETYPALEQNVFLNVDDLRGTGAGWRITAYASNFMANALPTLLGSTISLMNGNAVTSQSTGVPAPTVYGGIKLDCDGSTSTDIASAAVNQGLGSWSIEWAGVAGANNNVTVNIPVATVGTHISSINWTLTDAP